METRAIWYLMGIKASPRTRGTFLGVRILGIIMLGGLLGSPSLRNHLSSGVRFTLDSPNMQVDGHSDRF